MPTLSASDYTSFIKAQAASQAYRNGAIPNKIQTSDQPFATQSVLNAQLLGSQAAYILEGPRELVQTVQTTVSAASATIITDASAAGGAVTYTTSVAHGLVAGDVITISGLSTSAFNLSSQTVISSGLTATQFRFTNAATGTAVTGSTTGRINGFVYYTTNSEHGLTTSSQNLTIGNLNTSAFNLSLVNVSKVPSSTVFVIENSATGTAVSGAFGNLTITRYQTSGFSTINGVARVRPYDGVGRVNNPKNLVTLTQSGTLSSAKTQQLGGLPTTAPKGSGVYAPTPQLARVDTKATGGYRAVRQPV
jgi:hypothetical protein